MYRINLYPEYHLARKQLRQRARITAVVTGLLGLELILVAGLVMGDALLRQRITALRSELPALTVTLENQGDPCPGFETAQQMAELLASRVVWAPKLAALADRGGRHVEFTTVTGHLAGNGKEAIMSIAGACNAGQGLNAVNEFVTALRADRRVSDDLPEVALGNVQGEQETEFEVLCRRGEVQR